MESGRSTLGHGPILHRRIPVHGEAPRRMYQRPPALRQPVAAGGVHHFGELAGRRIEDRQHPGHGLGRRRPGPPQRTGPPAPPPVPGPGPALRRRRRRSRPGLRSPPVWTARNATMSARPASSTIRISTCSAGTPRRSAASGRARSSREAPAPPPPADVPVPTAPLESIAAAPGQAGGQQRHPHHGHAPRRHPRFRTKVMRNVTGRPRWRP